MKMMEDESNKGKLGYYIGGARGPFQFIPIEVMFPNGMSEEFRSMIGPPLPDSDEVRVRILTQRTFIQCSPRAMSFIEKTPEVCGGRARIRCTRITVWGLWKMHSLGLQDRDILDALPSLGQADLEAAWEYVAGNVEEIEDAILENR